MGSGYPEGLTVAYAVSSPAMVSVQRLAALRSEVAVFSGAVTTVPVVAPVAGLIPAARFSERGEVAPVGVSGPRGPVPAAF